MEKDICIIPDESGDVIFDITGAATDYGLALLQRLYVLLFTAHNAEYRTGEGASLLAFLDGGNITDDGVVDAVLGIACSDAVNALDQSDRDNVQSFTGTCENGAITCTLTLADGTTVKGTIGNG